MALVGVEREPLFSEPDALTTRPPPVLVDRSVRGIFDAVQRKLSGIKAMNIP